jgi:hypothetical protein
VYLPKNLQIMADGTAAAPDLFFFPDSDTGLFQPEADQLGFAIGGIEGARIDGDGFHTSKVEAGTGLFYVGVITVKESEANGASFFDNAVSFDSQRFYVSTGGDGKPLVSLNDDSPFFDDEWDGVRNLLKLNDGGLSADYAVGMVVGADDTGIQFYLTNTSRGANKHDPVKFQFHGEDHELDISGDNGIITLTAGSAISPTENFVHVDLSGDVATLHSVTGDWPEDVDGVHDAHARIASVVVQDAPTVKTDGALKIHAWTDHPSEIHGSGSGERGERGHLHALAERLRAEPAVWKTGCGLTVDNSPGSSLYVHTAVGTGYQLHRHDIPAQDTDGSDRMWVVNDGDTAYRQIDDLDGITHYSDGTEIAVNAYFTVVLWMVVSENQVDSNLMINVPSGGYSTLGTAQTDASGKTTYDIPNAYIGTAILLYELVLGRSGGGGTWTHHSTVDLRGVPGVAIGGGGATLGGEANTASNIGAGAGVWSAKVNEDLQFKSLKAQDSTISVTSDADEILLSATGSFYAPMYIEGGVKGNLNVERSVILEYDASDVNQAPPYASKFIGGKVGDAQNPLLTIAGELDTGVSVFVGGINLFDAGTNCMHLNDVNISAYSTFRPDDERNAFSPSIFFNTGDGSGVHDRIGPNKYGWGWSIDGTSVGYWAEDMNLHVHRDLKAGRVEAGIGHFYTGIIVDDIVNADQMQIQTVSGETGIALEDGDNTIKFRLNVTGSQSTATVDWNRFTYKQFRITQQYPTLGVDSWYDNNTGIAWGGTEKPDELYFRTGSKDAGHFDADQNLHVQNDLKASRVHAGPSVFYVQDEGTSAILVSPGKTGAPGIASTIDPDTGIHWAGTSLVLSAGSSAGLSVYSSGITLWKPLTIDDDGTPAAPVIRFRDDPNTGIYQKVNAGDDIAFSTGGKYAGHFDSDQNLHVENDVKSSRVEAGIGKFYTQVISGKGKATAPSYSFKTDPTAGMFDGGTYLGIAFNGVAQILQTASYTQYVQPIRIQNQGGTFAASAGEPQYTFLSDAKTGMFMHYQDTGNVDFAVNIASTGTHRGRVSADGIRAVDSNLYADHDVIAGRVEAGIGSFYTALYIGESDTDSDPWKIEKSTDGLNNLVISNTGQAGSATPREDFKVVIDGPIDFWPNIPAGGPTQGFAPMISFTPAYNETAILTDSPILYHAPDVTYTGNVAPQQSGIKLSGTFIQDGNTILSDTYGIKTDRTNTMLGFDDNVMSGKVVDLADVLVWDDVGAVSQFTAFSLYTGVHDQPMFTYENSSDVRMIGDLQSFSSSPRIKSDASGGSLIIDKFVGFRGQTFVSEGGSAGVTVGLHRYIQLENDTFAKDLEGIHSEITEEYVGSGRTRGLFINHTGGAPSYHTGDFNATKIIAGEGRFYVGVGFYDKEVIPQQTGVGVNIAEVHAALVNLGLITA